MQRRTRPQKKKYNKKRRPQRKGKRSLAFGSEADEPDFLKAYPWRDI